MFLGVCEYIRLVLGLIGFLVCFWCLWVFLGVFGCFLVFLGGIGCYWCFWVLFGVYGHFWVFSKIANNGQNPVFWVFSIVLYSSV